VEDVLQALGVGLTNVLHLYNPDLVVLGGGVSVGLEQLELLPRIEAIMTSRAMSEKHKEFRLVASSLGGDRAGIIGAAALAWDSLEQHAC
jgi:glucokinase